ncbi:MAG: hypothetical protein HYY05_05590 [Chloroflexi bacterium]|nr:hypothetical protein [Chloroflexota bacterium]
MCASCGCGEIYDTHGDDRNITMDHLEEAAMAAGITVEEVVEHLQAGAMHAVAGRE